MGLSPPWPHQGLEHPTRLAAVGGAGRQDSGGHLQSTPRLPVRQHAQAVSKMSARPYRRRPPCPGYRGCSPHRQGRHRLANWGPRIPHRALEGSAHAQPRALFPQRCPWAAPVPPGTAAGSDRPTRGSTAPGAVSARSARDVWCASPPTVPKCRRTCCRSSASTCGRRSAKPVLTKTTHCSRHCDSGEPMTSDTARACATALRSS
eukprot:scaffold3767_cov242-Prasinococcus_capsulatus_cf.AAC.9